MRKDEIVLPYIENVNCLYEKSDEGEDDDSDLENENSLGNNAEKT